MSVEELPAAAVADRARIAGREGAAEEKRNWVRLTYGCNNRCAFCLDASGHTGELRDREEVRQQLLDGRRKGATRLVLSGGEPTIHPSFVDFVRLGRQAGYRKVQAITNGRLFAYGPFLDRCLDAGLSEITFSLHGPDAPVHDALVGVKGAFEQETAGLRRALADGRAVVNVDVVVSRANVERLTELLDLCISWGVREFDLLQVVPFGRAWDESREALFYDLEQMRPHLAAAFAYARRPGLHVWLNRFPPPHLEGFEELIQDPHKLLDEVRGRREEFDGLLDDGTDLDCRDEAGRCTHCYLEAFCNTLYRARAAALAGPFEVVRVDTEWEANLPAAFGGDPASARRARPGGSPAPGLAHPPAPDLPAPAPRPSLDEIVAASGARRLRVVAPDLERALGAVSRFPQLRDLELELADDSTLPGALRKGLLEGRRVVRVTASSAAAARRLLGEEGGFEVVLPVERATEGWLLGLGEAPARLVLSLASRERMTESAECDVDLPSFFERFRHEVPVEGIPACVTGRPPRPLPVLLDTATISPGGLEIFRYARRYIADGYWTKSLRCRACVHDAACLGLPVNYVRAHGYAAMKPVPG